MLPEGFSVKVKLKVEANSSLFGVAIHCTVRDALYMTNVLFPHAELQWITSTFYILTERHICTIDGCRGLFVLLFKGFKRRGSGILGTGVR